MVNKRAKFTIILAILSLVIMLLVVFVQTAVLSSRHGELDDLKNANASLSRQRDELKGEEEYLSSEDYENDYKNHNIVIDKNSDDEDADRETIAVVLK